jgi:hypothetical protein
MYEKKAFLATGPYSCLSFISENNTHSPNCFNMSLKQNNPPGCCCISDPIDAKQKTLLPTLMTSPSRFSLFQVLEVSLRYV